LAKHQRIRCHGHVINLAVQAFLFMDSKEAVEAACQKIEELDEAAYNADMIEVLQITCYMKRPEDAIGTG
jgi:hypothetical protein